MEELHNTLKDQETPPLQEEPAPEPKKRKRNRLRIVLEGSFLTRERVIRQLPFLVLLTVIGVAYIFNSNFADKTTIQISKTKKELEELRFNYINTKSKLMQGSRQSELVRRLEPRGVRESKTPPRKIIIEETKE